MLNTACDILESVLAESGLMFQREGASDWPKQDGTHGRLSRR